MNDRRQSTNRRTGNERRQYARVKATTEVNLMRAGSVSGNEPLKGTLYDVSLDGIRVLLDIPLSIGESLLVEVHNAGKHLFNSTAKVIWQKQEATGKYATGCELCVLLTQKQEKTLSEITECDAGMSSFAQS
ncbi:PilZ domain-containing protein [Gimesia aquarii]|uniref:PilZ domain protein n=1 Tax=Gimesia aquarii TaxID=2527964 RepID=A0A517WP12_9PLAN|nr:PilZ domain-containing protein [Gimesia aquarii]QDU06994.1 PilZ domain protein [Gimesia aquarii]